MSKPVQALAPGYLGLLGLKNMGQLPWESHDNVQPTIEMTDFYTNGRIQFAGEQIAVVQQSANGILFVPNVGPGANEMWAVLGGALLISIDGGETFDCAAAAIVVNTTNPVGIRVISDEIRLTAAAPAEQLRATTRLDPVLMNPGDLLGISLGRALGADNAAVQIRVAYCPIPV